MALSTEWDNHLVDAEGREDIVVAKASSESSWPSTRSTAGQKKELVRAILALAAMAVTSTLWIAGSSNCANCAAADTVMAFDGADASRAKQWSCASRMGQSGLW